jgi:predicted enzyme related to lactoylglutathione lyase
VTELRICLDVPDLDRAIAFYQQAFGLRPGRRNGALWAEMLGAGCAIDLLPVETGTPASAAPGGQGPTGPRRDFGRHWTPVHLDLVVADLDDTVARAVAAGAILERPVLIRRWGRMANLADPFGHGFCVLQFVGRGYDELIAG